MGVLIAPSILSADFANLAAALALAEAGGADWVHVDVMDGHFVPNITIGPPVVRSLRAATRLPLDAHLMISEPDRYLEDFAKAGCNSLTVHAETCLHLQRTLSQIKALGMKAGVALNPSTPEDHLQYVAGDLDLVLVMTVNPGFGGQKFLHSVVPKITRVRKILDEAGRADVPVSVDGGIDPVTAPIVHEAGAGVLVAGKSIYGTGDVPRAIARLRDSAAGKAGATT